MNRPNKKEFRRMVGAWIKGRATKKEENVIFKYFDIFSNGEDFFDFQNRQEINKVRDRLKASIDSQIENQVRREPLFKIHYKYISVAAAIIIMSILSVFYYSNKYTSSNAVKQNTGVYYDIPAGNTKAILTLSNGSKVDLSENGVQKIEKERGINIYIKKGKDLSYHPTGVIGQKLIFNTIETPKGGQYKLILSDGTKVWLNAASSLRYPVVFIGNQRMVELSGEAYFEVSKNRTKPFIVSTGKQNVEVLGTHFNINGYKDESTIKTTLLEGKIKVRLSNTNTQKILFPGDQSLINLDNDNIGITKVDSDVAIAWKNGYFNFDNEPLADVLKQVSRWYDVEIIYQNISVKNMSFNGTLSKYSNLSKVLSKLQLAGSVKFKIERRVIVVY